MHKKLDVPGILNICLFFECTMERKKLVNYTGIQLFGTLFLYKNAGVERYRYYQSRKYIHLLGGPTYCKREEVGSGILFFERYMCVGDSAMVERDSNQISHR